MSKSLKIINCLIILWPVQVGIINTANNIRYMQKHVKVYVIQYIN
jgi:hypothetical protein